MSVEIMRDDISGYHSSVLELWKLLRCYTPFRLVREVWLTLQTVALGHFETSVTIQSTWPRIPEDMNLRNCVFVQ